MKVYCEFCDTDYDNDQFTCYCPAKEPAKPIDDIVGKIKSRDVLIAELEAETWNAALEKAALEMDNYGELTYATIIRQMKK